MVGDDVIEKAQTDTFNMNYSQLEHDMYDVINSINESKKCSEDTLATVIAKVVQNNVQAKF